MSAEETTTWTSGFDYAVDREILIRFHLRMSMVYHQLGVSISAIDISHILGAIVNLEESELLKIKYLFVGEEMHKMTEDILAAIATDEQKGLET